MIEKISRILVILMVIGIIGLITYGYRVKYDIENHGKETVGQYVSYRKFPKTESNYFEFYIGNKKYKEDAGRGPGGFKGNRGKFYKIIYSEKYPGSFHAMFDQQVTDTLKILEAGFSKEDIY